MIIAVIVGTITINTMVVTLPPPMMIIGGTIIIVVDHDIDGPSATGPDVDPGPGGQYFL
jgi:hypothetical protein